MTNRRHEPQPPTTPGNEPEGNPEREGNEIAGPDQAQPPSGLRPDLDEASEDDRDDGDGGGVGRSL